MTDHLPIKRIIEESKQIHLTHIKEVDLLKFALECIDLTTLEGSNTTQDILSLCKKTAHLCNPSTASVCVYPIFCKTAKNALQNTPVKVACVAGGFPAGQIPISLKINEVKYAIDEGADEIDMVISRGKFLENNHAEVFDEIAAIKEVCKHITLKVILETGELKSHENIYKASDIAIQAGADFIKTSTGKITVNATPESFTSMLLAIKNNYNQTGKQVGIKVSGGIRDITSTQS
ncbi:MAG: deoxyribose-phosphate aldolase, partial [Bacteroidales bacterium]|nr:deoxyribose-phosphate aldolase [Bacteroidales bacterium]